MCTQHVSEITLVLYAQIIMPSFIFLLTKIIWYCLNLNCPLLVFICNTMHVLIKPRFLNYRTIPPISTTQTISSCLKPLNTKKTTTYGVGNPSHCLGQAQRYGWIKLVDGIPILPFLIILGLTDINKQ